VITFEFLSGKDVFFEPQRAQSTHKVTQSKK